MATPRQVRAMVTVAERPRGLEFSDEMVMAAEMPREVPMRIPHVTAMTAEKWHEILMTRVHVKVTPAEKSRRILWEHVAATPA